MFVYRRRRQYEHWQDSFESDRVIVLIERIEPVFAMEEHRNRALLETVREQIMRDTRLAGQSITVTSSGGSVQIVGVVDTEEHKQLALDLARGMAGVINVEDRIEVRHTAFGHSE